MSISACFRVTVRGCSLVTAVVVATTQCGLAQNVLEEITVTAERREASLQETPISISAFTGEDLVRNGIETSEQLTGFTPGLQIQRDVIGKVVIRGIRIWRGRPSRFSTCTTWSGSRCSVARRARSMDETRPAVRLISFRKSRPRTSRQP
jgi:outer membrane receptor protein involved in Fe transport